MYPINVVEKETHISKYLLRMWERRYEFPRPERDQKGERVYTSEDIEKLKLVKKLMEEGYRPSKIINQPLPALIELSKSFFVPAVETSGPNIIILVTAPHLSEVVKNALKNHEVKKVFLINTEEDVAKLSL